MKILCLADLESPYLWDHFVPGRLDEYDLILSAGDLRPEYLSFLVTFAHCPVLYVHGNHDECYKETPPEGCLCIDDCLYEYKGVRILGLGGSMRYKPGDHQYTEKEMKRRILKQSRTLHKSKGFDILLTHAPARGIGDSEAVTHRGFACFLSLMDAYKPAYMIHGHTHLNYGTRSHIVRSYGQTTVINAYEKYVLTLPDREGPQTGGFPLLKKNAFKAWPNEK